MNDKLLAYTLSESIALFRTTKIYNFDSKLIKPSEFSILIIVFHAKDKISAVDISNYLHCSKVYVSKITNVLIAKGFLKKEKNSLDARQFYLYLTDTGYKLVKEYKDEYMKITNHLYEKLGEEKSRIFIDLLIESRNILRKYENNNK